MNTADTAVAHIQLMNIFVSEYVCSGAWSGPLDDAGLLNEAKGMLLAAIKDFSNCPGVNVYTTWDARLGLFPFAGINAVIIHSPNEESTVFNQLVAETDASFIIAPEFHELLINRCRHVESSGKRWLGLPSTVIETFSDKLATYYYCQSHGVPTIPTYETKTVLPAEPFFVHKPRFGAGSVETQLLSRDSVMSAEMTSEFGPMLLQPFIDGESLSAGIIARGHEFDILLLSRQILQDRQSFKYIGTETPVFPEQQERLAVLINKLLEPLLPVTGYLGIDLLYVLSTDELLVVEVNPRLTTSYLAYRQLTNDNLLSRLLPTTSLPPINWLDKTIQLRLS